MKKTEKILSEKKESQNEEAKVQISGLTVEDALRDKIGRRPRCNSTDVELKLPQRGLCDEQLILELHKLNMEKLNSKSDFNHTPPLGLKNLGNTCFLNAILQCLGHLPTFGKVVATMSFANEKDDTLNQKKMIEERKISNGQLFTMYLRTLVREMHDSNSGSKNRKLIEPRDVVNSISLLDGSSRGYHFRAGRQEDAHEFLVHLMDIMNDGELKSAGIDQKKSGWRDSIPIPRLDETTFVHRMFGGYLRSQVQCTICGFRSNTYDPFLNLSLEISTAKSISAAFTDFTRKETLDTANKWKCDGCKKSVCATKQLTCFRPPLSLCIQLKRFSFHFPGKGMRSRQGGSKIQKRVEFPPLLELPLSDGRKCDYELTGIVIHVGGSATSGHYTAYVRRPSSLGSHNWYKCDDSSIKSVSEKTVLDQNAYILFYCRKIVELEIPSVPTRRIINTEETQRVCSKIKRARENNKRESNRPIEGSSIVKIANCKTDSSKAKHSLKILENLELNEGKVRTVISPVWGGAVNLQPKKIDKISNKTKRNGNHRFFGEYLIV